MAIGALVICLSQVPTASGAAGRTAAGPLASHQVREQTATPHAAPEQQRVSQVMCDGKLRGGVTHRAESPTAPFCASARKAVKYYAGRIAYWRSKMGAATPNDSPPRAGRCPRYLAHVLQRKAHTAHKAFIRWFEYHWHWKAWLPAKWVRIGICETGLNWRHSNSSYEGAFGFALSSWDSFVPYADRRAGPYPPNAYMATPRQQYEVALAIWRRYGYSGWGCRGA